MHRKPFLLALPCFFLLLNTSGQNTNTGVVIPSDVRARLGDTNKVAQVLPPDTGFVGLIISHQAASYGVISQVIPNGPGDKAKLRVDDKIVTIAGRPITYMNGLDNISPALSGKVGAVVEITVLRGKEMVTVKLDHKKISFKTVKTPDGQETHVPTFED